MPGNERLFLFYSDSFTQTLTDFLSSDQGSLLKEKGMMMTKDPVHDLTRNSITHSLPLSLQRAVLSIQCSRRSTRKRKEKIKETGVALTLELS